MESGLEVIREDLYHRKLNRCVFNDVEEEDFVFLLKKRGFKLTVQKGYQTRFLSGTKNWYQVQEYLFLVFVTFPGWIL